MRLTYFLIRVRMVLGRMTMTLPLIVFKLIILPKIARLGVVKFQKTKMFLEMSALNQPSALPIPL